jgi:hypothetical protein
MICFSLFDPFFHKKAWGFVERNFFIGCGNEKKGHFSTPFLGSFYAFFRIFHFLESILEGNLHAFGQK